MAVSKIPNPNGILIGNVSGRIQKKHAESVVLSAPPKTGYRFVCWLYVITEGWVSNVYPAEPTLSTTRMFVADMGLNYDAYGDVRGYCLYVPI